MCYYEPDLSNLEIVCAAISFSFFRFIILVLLPFWSTSPKSVAKAIVYIEEEMISFARKTGNKDMENKSKKRIKNLTRDLARVKKKTSKKKISRA